MTRTIFKIILVPLVLFNLLIYVPYPIHYVDKGIEIYYNKYIENYNQYCKVIPNHVIILTKLDNGLLGLCIEGIPNKKIVLISERDWNGWMTDVDKYQVITHELGHCYLDKRHSTNESNYMYYSYHIMTMKQIIYQSEVDMKEHCGQLGK